MYKVHIESRTWNDNRKSILVYGVVQGTGHDFSLHANQREVPFYTYEEELTYFLLNRQLFSISCYINVYDH